MKNTIARVTAAGLGLLMLAGCSSGNFSAYDPAYISPDTYADYSCPQLHTEMVLTNQRLEDLSDAANGKAMFNAAVNMYAQSEGYNVDGPGNGADKTELRRLKNKYDVLEETAVRKNCMHVVPAAR